MPGKFRYSPKKFFLIVALILSVFIFVFLTLVLQLNTYFTWLVTVNLLLFFFYGYDKFMAVGGFGRVPEIVLHLLALAGGFAGGWAGMIIFRHKKNNIAFIAILLLSTVVHIFLIYQSGQDIVFTLPF